LSRRRVLAFVAAGFVLAVLLLDWTVSAVDALSISRQVDARRLRAAMRATEGGGLVPEPDFDAVLGRGAFRLTTGAEGGRIGRVPDPAPAAALRVLVVGGGAAMGYGVDDELSFARHLERARAPDGRPLRVTNAGHPFVPLVDAAALGAHWLPTVEPELCLLCGPTRPGSPDPVLRGIGAGAGQERGLLGRLLPALWELNRALGGELPSDAAAAPAPVEPGPALDAAAAACAARGVRLLVVDLGGLPELAALCAARGLERIEAGFGVDERAIPVFADPRNGWPNALGHERIAARLRAGLAGLGLVAD
jgi:hypothetical protein